MLTRREWSTFSRTGEEMQPDTAKRRRANEKGTEVCPADGGSEYHSKTPFKTMTDTDRTVWDYMWSEPKL